MSLQTLTSSFPSNTQRPDIRLDRIIFWEGPPRPKSRETMPLDADEWPDIDTILAEVSQYEGPAAMEASDPISNPDAEGEGIRDLVAAADSTVRTVNSPPIPLNEDSIPLPNSFDFPHGEDTAGSELLEPQEPLDRWDAQTRSVLAGQCGTSEEDVRRNSVDVGTTIQSRSPNDESILALWETFPGEEVTSAPVSSSSTPLALDSETDRPELPLHTQEPALGDMSPLAERTHAKQSSVIAGREQRSASPAEVASRQVSQDDSSRAGPVESATTAVLEDSACGRAHTSRDAVIAYAADDEATDSDGPPVTRRRRRPPRRICGSRNPSQPLTPLSSADSTDAKAPRLRGRKRLRRRSGTRRESSAPKTDHASASSITSNSTGAGEWRPVRCFFRRGTDGSREVITIQLPSFDLCAGPGSVFTLSPSANTAQTPPTAGVVRKSGKSRRRRRRRFTPEEKKLLVELKEQTDPKLSWRAIQRYFPHRSVGTLRVHYSTRLKKRHPSSSAL